ncbi:MAG: succinate dehydrogenase, cytochrome b556 subunit [Syntrophomonadaceae bacterium]|nr:succinate dehydrogenase, cytochrome b556 subunit [Syntrophomonadaceae bacterium]
MEKRVHRDNHLGLKGWAIAGKYGAERYLYLLHRITGLGLLTYLLLHVYVTGVRIQGEAAWAAKMAAVGTPFFKFGEFLVVVGFIFHALNGIRLLIVEFGYCIGKPERQEYPYVTSVTKQRPLTIAVLVLAGLLIALSGLEFFIL